MKSITVMTSMSIYRNIEIEAVDFSKHRDRNGSIRSKFTAATFESDPTRRNFEARRHVAARGRPWPGLARILREIADHE
jgi:hypothetical protein